MRAIDRFLIYLEDRGISVNKAKDMLQVSNGVIQKSKEECRDLSGSVLNKIYKVFPDLNKSWLLFGDGDMLLKDDDDNKNVRPKTNDGGKDFVPELLKEMQIRDGQIDKLIDMQDKLINQHQDLIDIIKGSK